MQLVPITTNVMSSIPLQGGMYSIQHYVINFGSQWFSPGIPVSSTNETDRHHITEILLKVALSTIILTLTIIRRCLQKYAADNIQIRH